MRYHSTKSKEKFVSLKDAVTQGLAPDGGLYMPESIPVLPESFFSTLHEKSLQEIGYTVAKAFVGEDVADDKLHALVDETLNFPIPLVTLTESISVLELFHGPTMAFKDVGGRFMARLLAAVRADNSPELTVLVATSGDTGSAVASGFFNVPGIKVVILYPSKRVSDLQEKQLTAMGGNISALEVEGNFDDCQRMVKEAFQDSEIRSRLALTSANSINIARLIPQMFYYFWAFAQAQTGGQKKVQEVVISVPSGNLGNLTAGLMAKRMGLPVAQYIASTNVNNVVPVYLATGVFAVRPSMQTISNAMDVGNPSNFARMLELYDNDVHAMQKDIIGKSFTDAETKEVMKKVYTEQGYMLDPHGAVGYLGLTDYLVKNPDARGIFFETAHPAKFQDVVEAVLLEKIKLPPQLEEYTLRTKKSVVIPATFEALKSQLLVDNG